MSCRKSASRRSATSIVKAYVVVNAQDVSDTRSKSGMVEDAVQTVCIHRFVSENCASTMA